MRVEAGGRWERDTRGDDDDEEEDEEEERGRGRGWRGCKYRSLKEPRKRGGKKGEWGGWRGWGGWKVAEERWLQKMREEEENKVFKPATATGRAVASSKKEKQSAGGWRMEEGGWRVGLGVVVTGEAERWKS